MSSHSAVDVIRTKRDGGRLSDEQIRWFMTAYTAGDVADEQASALAMAIFWRGMEADELATWTQAMVDSGERLDLSTITRPTVDKHSTGGVGDKVSLPLIPLAAACGVAVPQLSGRGLGHTGGTLDKMEAIPGWRAQLSNEEFIAVLAAEGGVICAAGPGLAPADRRLYALRDTTGTVESIPLITASIMSKKFAEGAESLVMDVKCGAGAFMKSIEEARALGASLVRAGAELGRRVVAVISDMDQPLGMKVGNFLEVEETIDCLQGRGPRDLMDLTYRLAGWMLVLGGRCKTPSEGESMARDKIADGSAMQRFLANVEFQGGDPRFVERPESWPRARFVRPLFARGSGFVARIDARAIGVASVLLGAGRSRKEDAIPPGVGITLRRVQGDAVQKGDEIALVHGDEESRVVEASKLCESAFGYSREQRMPSDRVREEITQE